MVLPKKGIPFEQLDSYRWFSHSQDSLSTVRYAARAARIENPPLARGSWPPVAPIALAARGREGGGGWSKIGGGGVDSRLSVDWLNRYPILDL